MGDVGRPFAIPGQQPPAEIGADVFHPPGDTGLGKGSHDASGFDRIVTGGCAALDGLERSFSLAVLLDVEDYVAPIARGEGAIYSPGTDAIITGGAAKRPFPRPIASDPNGNTGCLHRRGQKSASLPTGNGGRDNGNSRLTKGR